MIICDRCFKLLVEISGRDYEVKTIGHAHGICIFCKDEITWDDSFDKTKKAHLL